MTRILFLGEISHGQTSLMRMRAMRRLGFDVVGVHTTGPWLRASWVSRQVQRRIQSGSIVRAINTSVLQAAARHRPHIVWAEKQEFLTRETLCTLRAMGAFLIHFTPDCYFALDWKRTRVMDRAMLNFDAFVYCKSYERRNYEALGTALAYMPLGYCDEIHRPLEVDSASGACAVGFIGGWEPERGRLLEMVAAAGIDLKIWGVYWDFLVDGHWTVRRAIILRQLAGPASFQFHHSPAIAAAYQGGEVYGDEYARALSAARIGLGFLRKSPPDQHTTRTFEIPACGSMLIADRTDEHQAFFTEGCEAEFFSSGEELLDKIGFYDRNESARRRVAEAGLARCRRSGYAYVHRLVNAFRTLGIPVPQRAAPASQ
jgi:spore maturation protein CgeB